MPAKKKSTKKKKKKRPNSSVRSLSPDRMNVSHVNIHAPHRTASPVKRATPSVSRLNISNLSKMNGAYERNGDSGPNNRLNSSVRSVRSARSTRSLGRSWTASGRLATPRKSRESKTVSTLRLRLSGTHNTIRALQEQLHERGAEVEELRAQLLSKSRALEATRSFANVNISGSMNASFVARASCSSNGMEAQWRRKYETKIDQVSRECDEAVAASRRQLHRANEINGDLRRELEKVRDAAADAEDRLKETQSVLRETKRALVRERKFSAGLALDGAEGGMGAPDDTDDISGRDASVRTLRLEVKRLRVLLAKAKSKHNARDAQAAEAAVAHERRDKENAIQRDRGRLHAAKMAARVGLRNISSSDSNRQYPRHTEKKKVALNVEKPEAEKRHPDAVRFAKLKKMYDRAHGRS